MNIENIRNYIQMDVEGRRTISQVIQLVNEIDEYKKAHHCLPNDISDWYDQAIDWIAEQNEELDAMMAEEESIKEEYLSYVYENLRD